MSEIRKSDVSVNRTVHEGSGQTVCQADIIVPDTMPDVLKVLQVDGYAVTEGKVINDGKISVRGRIDCKILYVPENARGVKSIGYSIPFNYNENIPGAEENMYFNAQSDVAHIEYQPVNSRKISVKVVVEIQKKVIGKNGISYVCAVEGDDAEVKQEVMHGKNLIVGQENEITVSDKMPAPKGATSLLKCDADIRTKDIKIINNKVVAKGEIGVNALYSCDDDGVDCSEGTIPFTEILDAEGISENQITNVKYRMQGVDADVKEGEGGEKELHCNIKLLVVITSEEPVEFSAVSDIYGTKKKLMPTVSGVKIKEPVGETTGKVNLREIVSLKEGMPKINRIYNMAVRPYINECKVTGNGIKVEGSADCYVTYVADKEDSLVQTAMYSLPFATTISGNYCDGCTAMADAEVENSEYSVSGDNIELRINITIKAQAEKEKENEIVTDVAEEEESMENRPAMVLYFVQKGDSIWEIAKRYHSKISDIEQINKLEGNPEEGTMLLIPKK
ncbi:MAG: DUF3794 domain-containing protein [Bacillota bacterium]|nr:DUF3794 domain-containing protein [Bacillota bacterium]